MFELLNNTEELTKDTVKNKHMMFSLKEEIQKKGINANKIIILGKTQRSWQDYSQETFLGIINDYWFFYIEFENEKISSFYTNKKIEIVFDLFYNREIIKNEKEHNIREIKCMILYRKLYEKFLQRKKDKVKKI